MFEEMAFYDILIALRDQYNFKYGTYKDEDGVIINDKCKELAKKVKEIYEAGICIRGLLGSYVDNHISFNLWLYLDFVHVLLFFKMHILLFNAYEKCC